MLGFLAFHTASDIGVRWAPITFCGPTWLRSLEEQSREVSWPLYTDNAILLGLLLKYDGDYSSTLNGWLIKEYSWVSLYYALCWANSALYSSKNTDSVESAYHSLSSIIARGLSEKNTTSNLLFPLSWNFALPNYSIVNNDSLLKVALLCKAKNARNTF